MNKINSWWKMWFSKQMVDGAMTAQIDAQDLQPRKDDYNMCNIKLKINQVGYQYYHKEIPVKTRIPAQVQFLQNPLVNI